MRLLRRGFVLGVVAGVAYAAWRFFARHAPDTGGMTFEPQPFPGPPRPVPRAVDTNGHHVDIPAAVFPEGGPEVDGQATGIAPWIEPTGETCPASHPVKAKMGSGIYHVEGGGSYARTKPDRCYLDAAAAEADGLRPAKR